MALLEIGKYYCGRDPDGCPEYLFFEVLAISGNWIKARTWDLVHGWYGKVCWQGETMVNFGRFERMVEVDDPKDISALDETFVLDGRCRFDDLPEISFDKLL